MIRKELENNNYQKYIHIFCFSFNTITKYSDKFIHIVFIARPFQGFQDIFNTLNIYFNFANILIVLNLKIAKRFETVVK